MPNSTRRQQENPREPLELKKVTRVTVANSQPVRNLQQAVEKDGAA
jgi:hypothetical protein